ncbi:hypothetical protein NG99_03990 [Erwinia typographi]|uniref:Uncharacterized protein n=1 Tax=Erwinia typographi TaxID=371042 RepID=A0A0A3Z8E6_9GAMM|nr:hypothetical protein [Erwinia typographi]KGT95362.1 hypothetical protein NG99_03990 [Erwinia typographi]
MMKSDIPQLRELVRKTRSLLDAPDLCQLEAVVTASEELDRIAQKLRWRLRPTPGKVSAIGLILWRARLQEVDRQGRTSAAVATLGDAADLLKKVYSILNKGWVYRSWVSSNYSFVFCVIFTGVIYGLFSLALWAGAPLIVCSVVLAGVIALMTAVAIRDKDGVATFWSLYGLVPLYVLWHV